MEKVLGLLLGLRVINIISISLNGLLDATQIAGFWSLYWLVD